MTRNPAPIPILLYHWFRTGPEPAASARYAIPPERFEAQLRWLRAVGYTGLPLDALLGADPLPATPAVLTFDAGTADFYTYGAPLLEKYRFPATLFLVAGRVGGELDWDPAMPRRPLLTWAQIKELQGRGFTFGSHTFSHPRLSRLGLEPIERELTLSRNHLANHLGHLPRWLAYPYGDYDRRAVALARQLGYEGALAVTLRPRDLLRSRPFARARAMVKGDDSPRKFRFRLWLAEQIPTIS